ncbi:MAG TPA: ABC transporter ATP-binding protein [Anaerolineae bacterium]|nr:ABC transporter ATP-binding protein [Anaerolineae bacterium]
MMHLFECRGLVKSFGGLNAIDHLDFHIDKGEVVSIIGPNGAGKTTFFNLISGFYPLDQGEILLEGERINGLRPDQVTAIGIARTFQNVRLFFNMTILENVLIGQHCRTQSGFFGAVFKTKSYREEQERAKRKAMEKLAFFGTRLQGYRLNQPAFSLSYANRRRLEIARAMATEPKLLMLDEPTAGMNPRETAEVTQQIKQLRDELGYTILVIEHDMKVIKEVSDRVVAMDYGKKIAEGNYEEVATNEYVVEAYLGRQHKGGG